MTREQTIEAEYARIAKLAVLMADSVPPLIGESENQINQAINDTPTQGSDPVIKSVSDTPRTDERIVILEDSQWVNAPFAKQLEDELNEANSEINLLNRKVVLLYERWEEQNKRIKLLQHAGNEILRDNQDMENVNRWWKAKEVTP